ncbi:MULTISPECIES: SigB/SigF/SigG family RNA polymerase sigma factor [unclassified Streptomyces]|uniref:SigB/SigF/SigG family RNA polymerase sigma factor n=1 Tax=unclassified Streptomyces TaxID=2593676 RepID=UPI00081F10B5|nr:MULTISPECIES: SigB/SigF/SigG family RNA polymerase sigma factor [unclassified Streptomyces]MYR98488.1 SigB/SigF/SigG family RNA polymerase sigma factor [Streptomyces sp. SID4937]SCE38933.1 RNA polymerase sigma-B factor [Streptomyces sp. ScaeMP-e83]
MQAAPTPGFLSDAGTPPTDDAFERLSALPPGAERDALRDDIICAWLPMAHRLASRFRSRGESMDDLRQVAAMGLVKAVDRYDPCRGKAFETYAVPTVTGEIKRHFRDHTWDVHVPRRVQDLRNRVRTARRDLAQRLGGRAPTCAEIAAEAGLAEEDVLLGLEALESYSALSLDAEPAGADGGVPLADRLGSWDHALDVAVDREAVKPELRRLPERERTILYLRYFRDMTQLCIAERLGISQMHVSRLISRSCERVRAGALREAA